MGNFRKMCLETLETAEEAFIKAGFEKPERPYSMNDNDVIQGYTMEILKELNEKLFKTYRRPNKGFPEGYWHMVTVTCPKNKNKEFLLDLWEMFKRFFDKRDEWIQHASVEKSEIWHFHALVRMNKYAKNTQRDLARFLGVVVDIRPKITCLQKWNGACKYICKEGYDEDKARTHVCDLKVGIIKEDGKHWKCSEETSEIENSIVLHAMTEH